MPGEVAPLPPAHERARRLDEKLRRELGPLACGLLAEDDVVEVMLNPDGRLWVERLGQPMRPVGSMAAAQAESLMATVAATLGTTVGRDSPILEGELPLDGSRLQALLPPVVSAPVFAIRRRASALFDLDHYVDAGILRPSWRAALAEAVATRRNILVAGGTGSGKTTFANALIAEIVAAAPDHRLVILEDTAEIRCAAANAVLLRAGEAADMTRLVRATLRLRPDRIVVGEVRGGEALALLKAWNTGHPGGLATVHANGPRAGLARLEQLVAEATPAPMQRLIGEAVDLVVSLARTPQGRRVDGLIAVERFDGTDYAVSPLE